MTPEDELAIRNQVARTAFLADEGSAAELAALVAPDGTWTMAGTAHAGPKEVEVALHGVRARGMAGPGTQSRHLGTTVLIEPTDADTAVSRAQFLFYRTGGGGPELAMIGEYADTWTRQSGGQWLLQSREVRR